MKRGMAPALSPRDQGLGMGGDVVTVTHKKGANAQGAMPTL